MSRYLGSITKKSRRYGFSLLENDREFIKGKKRTYAPGQHGNKRVKLSGYGEQLQEKQKMMYLYGLNDRQFRRTFIIAKHMKGALTLNTFIALESRLDNLVFRMGFAPTRKAARQLVNHGHVLLDDKKVTIPSCMVKLGQTIEIAKKSKDLPVVLAGAGNTPCKYVDSDLKAKKGKFVRFPEREELPEGINEAYVVEWFNRLV
ncbi:MAG: 30S ribosomal protein S4 [Malacoplasma sp.]|nr:30S ribosomal protein S4 [Malacoplasma sp.]MDE6082243.1 30S ribosomal protein S4 [Malacoplasma sp.]MDE6428994.1 30S ribosomal protein S4 [Malacoplasma sp.]